MDRVPATLQEAILFRRALSQVVGRRLTKEELGRREKWRKSSKRQGRGLRVSSSILDRGVLG